MPRSRLILAGTLLLVLAALAVPALSLAGGSAGDQQYTDPFGGGSGSATTTKTTPASATTTVPATTTASPQTTAGAAPSTIPSASTGSADADPTTAAADPATTGQPTATIAGSSAKSLPYTGYDAWTAVGFGLTLIAGGAVLRWRLRPHRR